MRSNDTHVYAQRLTALREAAVGLGVRTVILVDPGNVMHLTGYWTILSTMMPEALVVTPDRAILLAPALERAAVDALGLSTIELLGFRNYPLVVGAAVDPARPFVDALRTCLDRADVDLIGTDLDTVRHTVVRDVLGQVPGDIVDMSPMLRCLRAEKDALALARIRRAAGIVAEAVAGARSRVTAGKREQEVAGVIAERIWSHGARATHIVIGSGPRSVILHAEPTDRILQDGDLVVMDVGVLFGGYWAEIARTMVVGRPSAEQATWHRTVLAAQTAAAARLATGALGNDIDAAARDRITADGYDGANFNHSVGHGLGLLGMDVPSLAPQSTDRLPVSCAVTVEPGLYFDGRGGLRIEDTFLLDGGHVEELTGWVSKDLG